MGHKRQSSYSSGAAMIANQKRYSQVHGSKALNQSGIPSLNEDDEAVEISHPHKAPAL